MVRGVIVAALAGEGAQTESFTGALPPGLPARPPLYPGATLIGSTRRLSPPPTNEREAKTEAGGQARLALYFIVLDTPDDREEVFSYYEEALDRRPWRLDAAASVAEADRLDFSKVGDQDISGIVQIVPGEEGGATSIFISLQDAGATLVDTATVTPEPTLPAPVPALERFPEKVPLPPDGVVTSSAYQRTEAAESFLLVLLTEEPPEAVHAFYQSAFAELGWSARESQQVADEQRLRFEDGAGELTGEVTIALAPSDPRLTEVDLRVRLHGKAKVSPTSAE